MRSSHHITTTTTSTSTPFYAATPKRIIKTPQKTTPQNTPKKATPQKVPKSQPITQVYGTSFSLNHTGVCDITLHQSDSFSLDSNLTISPSPTHISEDVTSQATAYTLSELQDTYSQETTKITRYK